MRSRLWVLGAALCVSIASAAQSALVTLQGKVIDGNGSAVSRAAVVILDGAGRRFSVTTDASGQFSLQNAPGVYETTVVAPGFRAADSPMTYAADATAIITLQPGEEGGVQLPQPHPAATGTSRVVRTGYPTWEYGGLLQGGVGVTDNRGGFRFLAAGAHLGRVLTPQLGTGALRGNFEYAVELFPYWQSFTPTFQRINCPTAVPLGALSCSAPFTVGGTFTGVSVTPIILRWNFTHGGRVQPWVQGAGGLLWTNHKFPAYGNTNPQSPTETGPNSDTSVWNFTPQGGVGAHIFVKPKRSVDFSANAEHISSASLGDRNPGVNASVQFTVGYTWWK